MLARSPTLRSRQLQLPADAAAGAGNGALFGNDVRSSGGELPFRAAKAERRRKSGDNRRGSKFVALVVENRNIAPQKNERPGERRMQYFGFAGSESVARARAEIKSRLLSSASSTTRPKPVGQVPGIPDAQAYPEGEPRDANAETSDIASTSSPPADKNSEPLGVSAARHDEATTRRSVEVKWVEPVFVEAISPDHSTEEGFQPHTVVDDARASDSSAGEGAEEGSTGAARLEAAWTPSASPRRARFRWSRRSAALPELAPGVATQAKEIAAARESLVDEIAALRRSLASERAAAAEEIASLRKTLTAEREAAADEIAALRTILAAQQEAAVARTTRIKAVLGAATSSPAGSD